MSYPMVAPISALGSSVVKNVYDQSIFPSSKDDFVVSNLLRSEKLISWNDPISKTDFFGFNNDFNAFIPLSKNNALLWTNHEYIHPLFVHGEMSAEKKNKSQVDLEMYNMGGSITEIKRENKASPWKIVYDSDFNRRITGKTKIPFSKNTEINGQSHSLGMVCNCAGGVTPWGTILTCEENYDTFHGERAHGQKEIVKGKMGWERFWASQPEHYGWVVEVNPKTGSTKKLISLGRFSHESATVTESKQNEIVCYSGDDKSNEFIYKFISSSKNSLDEGTLHVANLEKGQWLPIDINKSPKLKETFNSTTEALIHCRKAGRILGATPLDRPEDIEVHPKTGDIYICLTNNKKKGNYHGSILKISESSKSALKFTSETYYPGGKEFSCPDNIVFDSRGNLFISTDISGSKMGKAPYKKFKNNGLFVVPAAGKNTGKAIQIASAPKDAELTGLCFSEDESTLFVSVQHPGELTKDLKNPTSTWPTNKPGATPLSSVMQLQGPLLKNLNLI